MTESFAELFDQSYNQEIFTTGVILPATIIKIEKDFVYLDAGTKSEAYVDSNQFKNIDGEIEVEIGEIINMYLEMPVDGLGETRLSREKAIKQETLVKLKKSYDNEESVIGIVTHIVRGGLSMEIDKIRAFLPRSLADTKGVELEEFVNQKLEVRIVKFDEEKSNLIVSRRALVEESNKAEREQLLKNINVGDKVKGTVKNLTDYGAFIDLGGIDGLLHITDIGWKRVGHPSEVISIGQEIEVQVLRLDREKSRLSLGLKQLQKDPWEDADLRFPVGKIIENIPVSNITDYGAFVSLENAIDGLVHTSELDWRHKNIHPSKLYKIEDNVNVKIVSVDKEKRRMSLSIKQCTPNPWEQFAEKYKRGSKVVGPINSKTDFGLFLGLEGGIDGLIHITDISWSKKSEEELAKYNKGDQVEAVVLSLDTERERISLGIKQLSGDEFSEYISSNNKHSIVTGKVIEQDDKGAKIELAPGIFALLRKNEMINSVEDGSEITGVITSIDKKNRNIYISVKAREEFEEKSAVKEYKQNYKEDSGSNSNTIGDIIGDSLND